MRTCPGCGRPNPVDASFCMGCATPLATPGTAREVRRTVTVLFCDLVGSTSLAEQHDPEVLRPLLERYFGDMRAAVERHGGQVEKFIGDAVAAVFGLPVAHEDDALRAVRAGLEMQARIAALAAGALMPFAIRVGVSTGEVLVPGDGTPLIGDTMNTAARLQATAEPGQVVLGEPTFRLVRDWVTADPATPLALKGKTDLVRAYQVLSVHAAPAREATPLIGRERHLRMLQESLDDAIEARTGVFVTILAPPGIGKSRLVATFTESISDRATVLVGQTPSYGEGVTFAPLVELLMGASGASSTDAVSAAAALARSLASERDGPAVSDRLAQLLGVGDARGADPSWAVRRLFEVLAAARPVVVVLEDVHWAEPPMLDLAEAVAERVRGPLLIVCLARPELLDERPTWAAGKTRALTTMLPALAEADARRVAATLLGPEVPVAVLERVCATAEGNPLYLEQLAAMLVDQSLLVDGRWVGAIDAEIDIPASLQALMAARLDRIDPMPRLVLERASVEGRRFRLDALLALSPELEPDDVGGAMRTLVRSGLMQAEDESSDWRTFGHALIVETAYRGIAKAERAELHERLADWMLIHDVDRADLDEAVARHLERAVHLREEVGQRGDRSAALAARAGERFAAAGGRAFAALDFLTARDLLGRAAVLLPALDARRLDLLPNLGVALTETGRPDETDTLLSHAIEQSRAAGSERDALRATVQLLSNRVYRSPSEAEVDAAVTEATSAWAALEALGDDVGMAEAAITVEYFEYMRGRIATQHVWAFRALEHGLAAGRLRESGQAAADIVGTAGSGPLPFDQFDELVARLLAYRDEPIAVSAGHALATVSSLGTGDGPAAAEHERRWRDVIDRNGLTALGATNALAIATVEMWLGDAEAAERRLSEARHVMASVGDIWWTSSIDSALCAAVAAQDRPQAFLRLADQFDAAAYVNDRQTVIRRSLMRARALLLRDSTADAEIAARRGVELAAASDLELDHADALLVLGDVLDVRGLGAAAARARSKAVERLRAKGLAGAAARLDRTFVGGRGP